MRPTHRTTLVSNEPQTRSEHNRHQRHTRERYGSYCIIVIGVLDVTFTCGRDVTAVSVRSSLWQRDGLLFPMISPLPYLPRSERVVLPEIDYRDHSCNLDAALNCAGKHGTNPVSLPLPIPPTSPSTHLAPLGSYYLRLSG